MAAAQETSGLPLPRFVSVNTDRANMRTGPGERYPIEWVLVRKGMPVEVLAEYEHWRKVRDSEGTVGWIHKSLLSGNRFGLITGAVRSLRERPNADSPVVARAAPGVVARVISCRRQWCDLVIGKQRGWLARDAFWGVYADEELE